jgi:hypothetical protein
MSGKFLRDFGAARIVMRRSAVEPTTFDLPAQMVNKAQNHTQHVVSDLGVAGAGIGTGFVNAMGRSSTWG